LTVIPRISFYYPRNLLFMSSVERAGPAEKQTAAPSLRSGLASLGSG
jgi:hypothetical protein